MVSVIQVHFWFCHDTVSVILCTAMPRCVELLVVYRENTRPVAARNNKTSVVDKLYFTISFLAVCPASVTTSTTYMPGVHPSTENLSVALPVDCIISSPRAE